MKNNFISTSHIGLDKWLMLLAEYSSTNLKESDVVYIYEVDHPQADHHPGRYLAIFINDCVPEHLHPRKVSFDEILHYSDKFIPILDEFFNQLDLTHAVGNNLGSLVKNWYVLIQDASRSIYLMREKTWKRYFNKPFCWLYQTISCIANLKAKYLDYDHTGIYWPGNSCTYAIKILNLFKKKQQSFIYKAQSINEKTLRKALELPENGSLTELEIKKAYRNKMTQIHPDINPETTCEATRINSIYQDYQMLNEFIKNNQSTFFLKIQLLIPFRNAYAL